MSKKLIASIAALLIIIVTVVAAVFLIRQRQDIGSGAEEQTVTPTISLTPAQASLDINESKNVSISFSTGGAIISSVSVRAVYPYTGQTPQVVAGDLAISSQLSSGGEWTCPVQQVRESASTVQIDVACVSSSPSGFSSKVEVPLASFSLTANEAPTVNPVVISFDTTKTNITSKSTSEKISFSSTTGSYTIGTTGGIGGGSDLVTPFPTSTASATPFSFASSSPTSSATATPITTLPDTGVGEMFILASSVGLMLILVSALLIF